MKQLKYIILIAVFGLIAAQALGQGYAGTRVKLKQLEKGTSGQVVIAGTNGEAEWQTASFNHVTGISFNSSTGVVTLTMQDETTYDADLDGRYLLISDTSDLYHKVDVDALLDLKADGDTVYSITKINSLLSDKADKSETYTKSEVDNLLSGKVSVVEGKGLSTNDYTDADKTKLSGIATGAEVNVQSDWDQTTTTADDYIKSKPTKLSDFTNDENFTDKTYVDDADALKANSADVYDKTTADSRFLNKNQKGAANGIAPLGSDGRVPQENLPTGSTVYKGTWDASTNTPTLSDATGTAGWQYRVVVAGTQNLGSGNIQFDAGDDIIHNGTRWEKVPSSTLVNSVNGQQGTVVLGLNDINDVSTASSNEGQLLQYDGTNWTNWTPDYVHDDRKVIAGTGLTGGGDLSADRTLSIDPDYDGFNNYYTKTQSDGKYLQSFTEIDPVWLAAKSGSTTVDGNWSFSNKVNSSNYFQTNSNPATKEGGFIVGGVGGNYVEYFGSSYASGNLVLASNAYRSGSDEWSAGSTSYPSALLDFDNAGGNLSVYTASAGTAAGSFSSFWTKKGEIALKSDIPATPTLQAVTDEGNITSNGIIVDGDANSNSSYFLDMSNTSGGWARGYNIRYTENDEVESGVYFGAYGTGSNENWGAFTISNAGKADHTSKGLRLYPDGSLYYTDPPANTSAATQIITLGSDGHTIGTRTASEILADIGAMQNTPQATSWDSFTGEAHFITTSIDGPASEVAHGLYIPHANNPDYGSEIAMRHNDMWIRSIEHGTIMPWVQMADRSWVNNQGFIRSDWTTAGSIPAMTSSDNIDANTVPGANIFYGNTAYGTNFATTGPIISLKAQTGAGAQLQLRGGSVSELWFRGVATDGSGTWLQAADRSWVQNQNYLTSIPSTYIQSGDDVSELNNDAGYLTSSDLLTQLGNLITKSDESIIGTGTNSVTLSHTPIDFIPVVIDINGVVQNGSYTISGTTVTFTFTITSTDVVGAHYSYEK